MSVNVIDVFSYLKIGVTILGLADSLYRDTINLDDLNIQYENEEEKISNEKFHEAAKETIQLFADRDIERKKRSEYPDVLDCVLALVEELGILADRFETPQAENFIHVRSQIESIHKKYSEPK